MISADKKEYRRGFTRHFATSKTLPEKNIYSRRLLLFYSVECGLKYLLMDRWGIMNIEQIVFDEEKMNILRTHNINAILKELGQQGMAKFPPIKTCHRDTIDISTYHQVCRYGIGIDKSDTSKEQMYELKLKEIAQWILNERI